MQKKIVLFGLAAAVLMMTACARAETPASTGSDPVSSTSQSVQTWTITFNSNGGSSVAPLKVGVGGVATKPADPTRAGYEFVAWFEDEYLMVEYNWADTVTCNFTLYAKWRLSSSSSSTSEPPVTSSSDPISTDTSVTSTSSAAPTTPYGPDGSELVGWYLAGTGSLFSSDWSTEGGVQLYSNPGSTDKGCILNLTIAEGDIFKFTDGGSIWSANVDTYDDPRNAGLTNFTLVDDGYNGHNIRCDVTAAYDIYVNTSNVLWIELHS